MPHNTGRPSGVNKSHKDLTPIPNYNLNGLQWKYGKHEAQLSALDMNLPLHEIGVRVRDASRTGPGVSASSAQISGLLGTPLFNKITWSITKTSIFASQENRRKTSPYPNATNIKPHANPRNLVRKEVCVCTLCINRMKRSIVLSMGSFPSPIIANHQPTGEALG